MSETSQNTVPVLATPVVASSAAAAGILLTIALVFGLYYISTGGLSGAQKVPAEFAQLSEHTMTVIAPNDSAGIAAALDALQLSAAQKRQTEADVKNRRRQLAWIVFVDSMDPDGDVVAVESGGTTQHVTLTKAWTPVAVPLSGGTVGITGIRDGGGGGITVALGTRGGPIALRILTPGERIEVAAP